MKHEVLMESYFQEKEVSKRSEILKQLLLDIPDADMPDCFKDIFTLDELGNVHTIRNKEEVENSWRDFSGR